MPLLARMVAFPLTVDVRSGAVSGIVELLADRRLSPNGQVAVAIGPGQGEQIVQSVGPALGNADVSLVEGGTLDAAHALAASVRRGSYDAVVGIGGGKTLDVAKYAATLSGLPDGGRRHQPRPRRPRLAGRLARARGRQGAPTACASRSRWWSTSTTSRRCPREQLRSGIGDAVSNVSALADWELAARERGRADGRRGRRDGPHRRGGASCTGRTRSTPRTS